MFKWYRRYKIRRRVLREEAKAFCKNKLEETTYIFSASEEKLQIESMLVLIRSLKSWTEKRIYLDTLKPYQLKLKQKFLDLEEKEIAKEVKGDLKKLEEVNDVLDSIQQKIDNITTQPTIHSYQLSSNLQKYTYIDPKTGKCSSYYEL